MPSIPQPPERMGDELIQLRPIAEWDIPEVLIAHQDDRELHQWLGLSGPPTGAQLGREVDLAEAHRLAGELLKLTIVEPDSNDCRGRVEINDVDWRGGTATLHVWVVPQLRGLGYEQRAAQLAEGWLRSIAGLRELSISLRV